ncbi:MAG: hypothetical protein ACW98I_13560 [Candidatus Hodarchaeales archaeon]
MSRERRNVSQRKIRKISRKPEDDLPITETRRSTYKFNELSPNTRMYYTKVISGAISGLITGTIFLVFSSISPGTWFFFWVTGLSICIAFIRLGLKITPDEVDQKRLIFSGTFTYTLLFIVISSLIWMLQGPNLTEFPPLPQFLY